MCELGLNNLETLLVGTGVKAEEPLRFGSGGGVEEADAAFSEEVEGLRGGKGGTCDALLLRGN